MYCFLVHHTGHGTQEQARGASELPVALDHEFRVEPYDEGSVITQTLFTNTKNKNSPKASPMIFDMITVGLGVMEEVSTLVP